MLKWRKSSLGISVKIDEQTVGKQYHIYLKEQVRFALKLEKGDKVEFHIVDNEVILRKKREKQK